MRTLILAAALAGSLLAFGPSRAQTAPPPATPPAEPLETPQQHNESNAGNAASGPMRDMNIYRQEIPPVLVAAETDPYARPPRSCPALVARLAELDAALGPDLDQEAAASDPESRKKTQRLSLLHAGSEMLLPFSGAVRALSGAEKHDQEVLAAIIAGATRRGYLKGLGEARGCRPPAAPATSSPSPHQRSR